MLKLNYTLFILLKYLNVLFPFPALTFLHTINYPDMDQALAPKPLWEAEIKGFEGQSLPPKLPLGSPQSTEPPCRRFLHMLLRHQSLELKTNLKEVLIA